MAKTVTRQVIIIEKDSIVVGRHIASPFTGREMGLPQFEQTAFVVYTLDTNLYVDNAI